MIPKNHSLRVIPFCLVLLLSASACGVGMGFERTEDFEETYPASALKFVLLENRNGHVKLEAWDRAEIHIKATKRVRGLGQEKAREKLEELKVEVTPAGETLTIRTVGPRKKRFFRFLGGSRSGSVEYEIKLPRRMNVEATLSNGRIAASGLEGEQLFHSANGKIQVQGGNGPLEAQTVNGAVEIDGARGALAARTVNGSIRTQNIQGSLRASTTNGSVRASFSTSPSGEVELNTTNGSLRLTLPAQTHAHVSARTVNGSITTDFPLLVQGKIGKKIEGKLGDGGPPMTLSTVNGSIRISKAEAAGD